MSKRLLRAGAFALAVLLGGGGSARAEILIGQTAGFTGQAEAAVKEISAGARLYLDWVNDHGGVHGQKLTLLQLDDHYDPPRSLANALKLITEQRVLALFLSRGTANVEAILPLLEEHGVPLVAPSSGAMVLHQPVRPHVFNVRAPYQREAERAIRHFATIGLERIAVLHVDDGFGADAAAGAIRALATLGRQAVALDTFPRNEPDFQAAMRHITAAHTQGLLFVGSGPSLALAVKALRAAGSRAQVATLSNNAALGTVKLLGDQARGLIVTQVFPDEHAQATPIAREAMALLKARGTQDMTPAMMEGFAGAKVLVEGLRRAGPNPTRDKLTAALNGLRKFDLGGVELGYSPTDHTGVEFSDLSIVGADGRFHR